MRYQRPETVTGCPSYSGLIPAYERGYSRGDGYIDTRNKFCDSK